MTEHTNPDDLFTFIGKALSASEPARLAAAKEIYTALQHAEEHRNAYDFDTDTYKVHEIERRLLSTALSLLARDYRWGAFINRANAKDIGGDLKAIIVMLQFAAQKLKRPRVRLARQIPPSTPVTFAYGTHDIFAFRMCYNREAYRTSPAGSFSLYITGKEYGYAGDVTKDGKYIPYTRNTNEAERNLILEMLGEFANDPAKVAKASSALMHECSFCGRQLSDPRSKAVGYGPDCAANFGLPWGTEAEGINMVETQHHHSLEDLLNL